MAIRFRSRRGSLSSDVTTGSSYLKLLINDHSCFQVLIAEERENNETNDLLEKKNRKTFFMLTRALVAVKPRRPPKTNAQQ